MNIASPSPVPEPSEQELVELAKQEDAAAFAALSDRYMPVLQSRAGRYSNIVGVDTEDFVQEGMLALYRAVKGYDAATGIRFRTYAITCINNSMTSAIRTHMKDVHRGQSLNIDEIDEHSLHQQTSLHAGERMVEDIYFDRETSDHRARQIATLLSDFERQVLERYLSGQSYQHISHVLSTSTKAVDNALQRVRRKLRPEL